MTDDSGLIAENDLTYPKGVSEKYSSKLIGNSKTYTFVFGGTLILITYPSLKTAVLYSTLAV